MMVSERFIEHVTTRHGVSMNGDLVSITEAAKKLGVPRSTLTKLLDESGIQKVKHGRETLVSFIDASQVVDVATRTSRIKSRVAANATGADPGQSRKPDDMTLFLMDQVRTMQRERDELLDKVRTLEKIQGDNRLLQLAANEKDRKIADLESELEKVRGIEKRKGASAKSDIKSRTIKAIGVMIGKGEV